MNFDARNRGPRHFFSGSECQLHEQSQEQISQVSLRASRATTELGLPPSSPAAVDSATLSSARPIPAPATIQSSQHNIDNEFDLTEFEIAMFCDEGGIGWWNT
jgi:hypothetical protein